MILDLSPPPTGRLAPSPTGGLHLGHARTFLLAWLAARAQRGRVVLRIEDIDATRLRPEAIPGALADLRWLGLDWDEGPDIGGPSSPYLQSGRLSAYARSLDQLKQAERVYPCTCTRADILRAASAPHAADEGPTYPGTCSGRSAADADLLERQARPFAWRFRVPPGLIWWDDLVLGPTGLDPCLIGGDFVVWRGATPSYQLAVVHDDAVMGITQVIRGDDLTASTPRQVLLYLALDHPEPTFGHIPLVVGPDGRRLAKRDGSIKLSSLRSAGADPRLLIGWLARSCGWTDHVVPSTPADWLSFIHPATLPRTPCVFSPADTASLTQPA